MEEIIKEIEKAEREAAQLKADAENKAAEILSALERELKALKENYESRLKDDSASILAQTKQRITALVADSEEKSIINAKKIKELAHDKIMPCVDYVYDFLIKEFN